jgi:Zn-dependent metalloprotease
MIKYAATLLMLATGASLFMGWDFPIQAQIPDQEADKMRSAKVAEPRDDDGQPVPEVIVYWQALAARGEVSPAVTWNKHTGTPASIFGKMSGPSVDVSETSARGFLTENASLFKMRSDTNDLELVRSFESPLGTHFVFEQHYNGIPVYGSQAAVNFNRAGEIIAVNNSYKPGIALRSLKPQVGRANALARANDALGRRELTEHFAKLVVYGEAGVFLLAWQVIIPAGDQTWEAFIDARSGALLSEPRDINRYVEGTGQVFIVNAIVATHDNSLRDNDDAASAVPIGAYTIVPLHDLSGNGFLDGLYASSSRTINRAFSSTGSFVLDRSSDGFSETMGYFYIDYAERYIQSLGFTNVNNRRQVFSVNRSAADNSSYSTATKEISFGLGGVDDAEDADIIGHEYGHSIQDDQVPGFGSSPESGSMGEGFADYWAGTVGAQFSGGFQDTCLAEWDATSYDIGDPTCLRRLDSTKHYPEDLAGEAHADGEMWSATLWQIRSSIGAAQADTAILAAHFLLAPNASFDEGARALLTAAENLGYSNQQVNLMRKILRERGFSVKKPH